MRVFCIDNQTHTLLFFIGNLQSMRVFLHDARAVVLYNIVLFIILILYMQCVVTLTILKQSVLDTSIFIFSLRIQAKDIQYNTILDTSNAARLQVCII